MLISIQPNWLHLPADLLRAELNFHRGEELRFHFTLTCFSSTFLIELHVDPEGLYLIYPFCGVSV